MDYEALGRYTEAIGQAQKAYDDFERSAKALNDELRRVVSPLRGWVMHLPAFDRPKIQELMAEAARHHAALEERCHEANVFAERCGKPLVTVGRGPSCRPV